MVQSKKYQDLVNEILKNIPDVNLTLPSSKQSHIKINFIHTDNCSSVYNGKKPSLPFARSEEFQTSIKEWRRLTSAQSSYKPIYEISFDISGSNVAFRPGDTIGIIPKNNKMEVDSIINHLGLQSIMNCQYILSLEEGKKGKIPVHIPVNSTIKYVLTHCVDLRGVVKKLFLLALSKYTKDESEKNILEFLCSKEGSTIYTSHVLNKNICLIDFLNMFKSCNPPIEILFEHLPRLLPRPYSIVNTQHFDPNLIKICFSVMDIGSYRKGLTTGWLEEIIINDTLEKKMEELYLDKNKKLIPIYLRQNQNGFSLPEDPKKPIILISIGTGVAPFIGFLEEREHLNRKQNFEIGFAWLFHGCRDPGLDFIYKKELMEFLENKSLSKISTAFSRVDNTEEKYIQNVILKNGEELTKYLKEGAFIYICGDVNVMVAQVIETLVKCISRYDNISDQEAKEYISKIQKDRRLLMDVWN